jgi:polysaccharide chain length determinant protein (PEP-CTERM system associated)
MQQLMEQVLDYLRGMWHRRWYGLAVAWVAVIVGAVWVFRLPDLYEAQARVYVDTQSMLRPLMQGMTVNPDAGQQTAILSRTLLSRPNVAKIIRKSDLDTSSRMSADDLIDATLGSLRIQRTIFGENIYTIAFRYTEPKKAQDVVQAALSIFIEQSLGDSRTGADSARKFLDEQIKDYDLKLRESEARVNAFRLKYMGLFPTSGKDFVGQMGAVGDAIRDTKLELRVAEQTRDGIKKQLDDQLKDRSAAIAADPSLAPKITVPELDARIELLKRQLDELLRNYTEAHPDVKGIRRLLARLEEDREREIEVRRKAAAERPPATVSNGDPIADQLKVAVNEAEAQVNTLRARVAELETRYVQLKAGAESLPRIDTEFTQLNRDYEIQKRQYENLVSRRETAMMTGKLEDAGVAEFRIIDPPRVTPTPVAPNRIGLIWGLIAASLAAGLATAFAVSQVHPTFHNGRALREIAGRPLLGMVSMIAGPEFRMRRRRSALLFAGGMGGLMASYAIAFAVTVLGARGF